MCLPPADTLVMRRDGSITATHGHSKHPADCECPRCIGWPLGNTYAMTHGAKRSEVVLAAQPETREIVHAIAASVPFMTPGAEITVELLAVTLRRIQLALVAIEKADEAIAEGTMPEELPFDRLRGDLRSWISLAAKLSAALALTPTSYAKLTRDLGLATDASLRAQSALERLHTHLTEHHHEKVA